MRVRGSYVGFFVLVFFFFLIFELATQNFSKLLSVPPQCCVLWLSRCIWRTCGDFLSFTLLFWLFAKFLQFMSSFKVFSHDHHQKDDGHDVENSLEKMIWFWGSTTYFTFWSVSGKFLHFWKLLENPCKPSSN